MRKKKIVYIISDEPMTGIMTSSYHTDDTDMFLRIHHVIGSLSAYDYRRGMIAVFWDRQIPQIMRPELKDTEQSPFEGIQVLYEYHSYSTLDYLSQREYKRQWVT